MSGISVLEQGEGGTLVELRGEFDLHDLEKLRGALGGALDEASTPARPAVVDLSGVTFLDIGATRELAICSQLYARRMIFLSPSPAVLASVAACGLTDWFDFGANAALKPQTFLPASAGGLSDER